MLERSFYKQGLKQNLEKKPAPKFIEEIKNDPIALNLLCMLIHGKAFEKELEPSLNKEEFWNTFLTDILIAIRRRYRTIDEIKFDLIKKIKRDVSIERRPRWTDKQYQQEINAIRRSYFMVIGKIINALGPIYQEFGPLSSEDIKKNILKDFRESLKQISPENFQKFRNNFIAYSMQDLSLEEINEAFNLLKSFLGYYKMKFDDLDHDFQVAIRRIAIKKETHLDVGETLNNFRVFVEKNFERIKNAIRSKNLEELENLFYYDFYSMNVKNFINFDENFEISYRNKMGDLIQYIYNEKNKEGKQGLLETEGNDYWFQCKINGGANQKEYRIGRLYVNLKPEYAPDFFREIVVLLRDKGIKCNIKIFRGSLGIENEKEREEKRKAFNRLDKIVIYFYAYQNKEILDIIEAIYPKYREYFNDEIPKFTISPRKPGGLRIKGIGFGENPENIKESFGSLRSKILAKLCIKWQENNWSPDFNLEIAFREICKENGIDPFMPAFNIETDGSRGSVFFDELFTRVKS